MSYVDLTARGASIFGIPLDAMKYFDAMKMRELYYQWERAPTGSREQSAAYEAMHNFHREIQRDLENARHRDPWR